MRRHRSGGPSEHGWWLQATVEGITLFTTDSLVAQYPGPIRAA
jgi:hypothetical protein